jgi:HK97 family phage portal protein
MSLLFRRDEPRPTEARDNISMSAYAQLLARSNGDAFGVVDGDSSMRHDAVWSCRTRIAQDVSMMPVDVVRYTAGRRQVVDPVPRIISAPSLSTPDAMDWRYQVLDSWLGWGNAWGLTSGDGRYPDQVDLLHPSQVSWRQLPGDRLRFFVDNTERFLWPVGDLWHRPAYPVPGSPIGLSPIGMHAAIISGGLNASKFGNDFFVASGIPPAILTVDPPPANATEATKLKQRLMDITRGNREPLVLPKGTEYKQISVNPNDSQFIETQRYTVEQICRIFGEDPVDHGASAGGKGSVTYANRSDADLARLKRRQFWVTKMQNALTDLIPRPQYARLNTSVSLMMTARERHELHGIRLAQKTRTVNEVRVLEDEEPFPGAEYDEPGIPDSEPAQQQLPFDSEGGAA